jgi:hypothetical protein
MATYTAPEVIAIIAAIGGLVITVASQIGNLIIAWRTSQKVSENTKVTTEGLAEVSAKADVITGHVNSQASTSAAEIAGLRQQIDMMHAMLADSKQTAAVLASAAAHTAVSVPIVNGTAPDPSAQETHATMQEIHAAVTEPRRVRESDKP